MTGFWLVSYIVLWVVVIGEGLVILMLSREIESVQTRLEAVERRHHRANGAGAWPWPILPIILFQQIPGPRQEHTQLPFSLVSKTATLPSLTVYE